MHDLRLARHLSIDASMTRC